MNPAGIAVIVTAIGLGLALLVVLVGWLARHNVETLQEQWPPPLRRRRYTPPKRVDILENAIQTASVIGPSSWPPTITASLDYLYREAGRPDLAELVAEQSAQRLTTAQLETHLTALEAAHRPLPPPSAAAASDHHETGTP